MKTFAAIAALMLVSCAATAADLRQIDDGYTISQRFEGYKDKYSGIAWPVVEFQAGQRVLFDQRYKRDGERELHADIFLPASSNGQGILLVHGGGWRSGDKSHFYALANRLAQRGYTVILPEFVTEKWWTKLLHNQTGLMLKWALLFKRGVVVTNIRYYVDTRAELDHPLSSKGPSSAEEPSVAG